MTDKGRKQLKIFLRVLLIISLLPWAFTLGVSLFSMIFGFEWGLFEASYTIHGGEAFISVWMIYSAIFLPIYIITGILALVCIIVLLNMRKTEKGKPTAAEVPAPRTEKQKTPLKKVKTLKITAFVLLIISFVPWLYTLGLCIYKSFDGIPVFYNNTEYGFGAFIGTLLNCLLWWPYIYLAAAVLTIIAIIIAITAINKEKKVRKEYAESNNDLR